MFKNIIFFLLGFISSIFLIYFFDLPINFTTLSSGIETSNNINIGSQKNILQDDIKKPLNQLKCNTYNKSIVHKVKKEVKKEVKKNDKINTPQTKQQKEQVLRKHLVELIESLPHKKLSEAKFYLELTSREPVDSVFTSEKIDSQWAIQQEDKLTYKFYENPPYDGNMKLKSLECRKTLCRLTIIMNNADSYNEQPGLLMNYFPNTLLSRPMSPVDDENLIIELFISPQHIDRKAINKD